MYRLILSLIYLGCFSSLWGQAFHTERIFLATKNVSCMPDDTLFAYGQVTLANNPTRSPYSRYVYIECIDDRDSLLLRQKVACREEGSFDAAIPTELEWKSNLCYLRAYTQSMLNYELESFTIVPFLLGATHPPKAAIAREIHAQIFPESGRLLNGFQQNLAFHLTDDDGFPIVPTQVRLLDAANDTILHQIAVSDHGLGRFAFLPTAGKQYRLQVEYDNRLFHFPVETASSGTALQAIINRNRLVCSIFSSEEQPLHLFLYHAETGLKEIPLQTEQAAAVIDLSGQPKGIYTLFLTNNTYQLLNERILWWPETGHPDITCQLPQTLYSPKSLLNEQWQAPDSSLVLSRIVSENDLMATQAYPALLFGNEIASPVHFPLINSRQWPEQVTEINNWLFTTHFTLFSIEKLLNEEPAASYPPEDTMLLSGTAWKASDRPLEAGTIVIAQNTKEAVYYSGVTDDKGHFIILVDNYPAGTRFILSAQDLKGKQQECTFTLDEKSYPKVCIPNPIFRQTQLQTDILPENSSIRYSVDENQEKVYHIDNVTVKARKSVDVRKLSRTPINFIGEIELQKRAGLNVRSILNQFPTIVIRATSEGGGVGELGALQKRRRFSNEDRDRVSTDPSPTSGELGIFWQNARDARLGGGGGNAKLTVVVDDEIAFGDIGHILDQPAGNLKSIELLKPNDTRCARYNALGGVLLIQSLHGLDRQKLDQTPQTSVYPLGLSHSSSRAAVPSYAPQSPGRYLLLVDIMTKDKRVASFCHPFEVR